MQRNEVIAAVAGDLHSAEKAIDDAIVQATALVQSMIGARSALNVAAGAGTVSQAKASAALASRSAAREAIVSRQNEMAKERRRTGYGVCAAGPVAKPDEWDDRPMGHLRVA